MRFRKKPVEIEAVRWDGTDEALNKILGMITKVHRTIVVKDDGCIYLQTLEGEMRADNGDWVIRGVKGEVYPCKPDIFALTYDPVE